MQPPFPQVLLPVHDSKFADEDIFLKKVEKNSGQADGHQSRSLTVLLSFEEVLQGLSCFLVFQPTPNVVVFGPVALTTGITRIPL